jgi:hypothetical protein
VKIEIEIWERPTTKHYNYTQHTSHSTPTDHWILASAHPLHLEKAGKSRRWHCHRLKTRQISAFHRGEARVSSNTNAACLVQSQTQPACPQQPLFWCRRARTEIAARWPLLRVCVCVCVCVCMWWVYMEVRVMGAVS